MPRSTANRPCVGDETWFVEWTIKQHLYVPNEPEHGGDPALDETRTRRAKTQEDAERIAREVYPKDLYGVVRYWPAQFIPYDEDDAILYPHAGYWDSLVEYDYLYEGEDPASTDQPASPGTEGQP